MTAIISPGQGISCAHRTRLQCCTLRGGLFLQGPTRMIILLTCITISMTFSVPVAARDRLGVYQSWAAFRDPETPRCYAIAAPEETARKPHLKAFFSIGFWPRRRVSHQIFVQLSRERASNSVITISAAGRRFRLNSQGSSGWASDRRMDLAIIAAMRSDTSLSVESIGRNGRAIVDAYALRGAPSAIDAAALGCVGHR